MSNGQNRIGMFLYYPGNEYTNVAKFLQNWQPTPYWGRIRGFQANSQIISKFIPDQLQQAVQSWLLLYRSEEADELLIIPFPEPEDASMLTDTRKFSTGLSALLEYIGGGRQQWYPFNGFRNLIDLNQKRAPILTPFRQISPPRRFQVIRLDQPLDIVLRQIEDRSRQTERDGNEIGVFTEVNQRIQQRREETLQLILAANDAESIQEAIEEFEQVMLHEGMLLSGSILTQHKSEQVVPEIVHDFEQIMDEETKSFLISAATVAHFASKYLPNDFDFSIPGCGLWKAVERELNLSFIWHLRRYHRIAGENPFKLIAGAEVKLRAGNRKVNLSEPEEEGSDLPKGIELGKIEYLLGSASRNGVVETIKLVGDNELSTLVLGDENSSLSYQIGQLRYLRNGYAHIKRMPYAQYQQLSSIVLSSNKQRDESHLAEVLWMKRTMMNFWKEYSNTEGTN